MTLGKKEKTAAISLIVLAGLIVAVTYHHILGTVFGWRYPYDTFLFTPNDRYTDFFKLYIVFNAQDILSSRVGVSPYFPVMLGIEYLFFQLSPLPSFAIYTAIFTVFLVAYVYAHVYRPEEKLASWKDIIVLSLLSYPFLVAVDRGNGEMIVFMLLALFVFFYLRGDTILGVILIAVCTSTKMFPALMLVLYIKQRKYLAAAAAAGLAVALMIVPLYFTDFITPAKLGKALSVYQQGYVLGSPGQAAGLGFGHSLFGAIRLFFQYVASDFFFSNGQLVMRTYMVFALLCAAAGTLYVVLIEQVAWRMIAILILMFNLLPYVSGDYKLLHLFIPLLLFIDSKESSRFDLVYVVLFGLLFVPKAYYIFPGIRSDSGSVDISISILLNPLLMTLLVATIVYEGWQANGRRAINDLKRALAPNKAVE